MFTGGTIWILTHGHFETPQKASTKRAQATSWRNNEPDLPEWLLVAEGKVAVQQKDPRQG